MPQNEVKVVFTTDDAAVAATAKKIHDALGEFEKVRFGQGLDQSLQKTADEVTKVGKAGHEASQGFSKVAEHSSKAHQALELFGKAGERILQPLSEVKSHVVSMGLAFVGVGGAWEMVKHVFEEGQAFNAAAGRFRNLVGDSEETRAEFEKLQKVSDETGLHIGDIARGAEGLYAAGEKVQGLGDQMENLAKISVITGTDLGELTELLDRMKTHGDVTFRELFRLTQATGGATRELAVQYRDLPKILEAATKAFDTAAKIQEHATKVAEGHRDALEGVAKKGGLAEQVFKDFGQALERTAGRGLPTMDPSSFFDVKKFGAWGQNAAQELWGSFNAGVQQLSSESGVSVQSVIAMVRGGLYSMDELLTAAKQRRQAIAEQSKAALEASKAMMESQVQQQQVAILDKIVAKLNDANAIQEKFTRTISGWGSEIRLMGHEVEKVFEGIGVSWIKGLKPALDALSKGDFLEAFGKLPGLIQAAVVGFGTLEAVKVWNTIASGAQTALKALDALIGGVKALQVAEEAEMAVASARAGVGGAGAAGGAAAAGAGGTGAATALAGAIGPVIAAGVATGLAAGALRATTTQDPRLNLAADVAQKKAEADQRYIERQQSLDPSMEGYKKSLDDATAAHEQEIKQIEAWRQGRERAMFTPPTPGGTRLPEGTIAPITGAPGIDQAEVSRLVGGFAARTEAREKAAAGEQRRGLEEAQILQKAAPYTMPTKEVEQYVERYAKYVADYRAAMREAAEGDTKRLQAVNAEREQLEALAATITPKAGAEADAFEEATKTFAAAIAATGQETSESADKNKESGKDIKDAAEKNNASAKNIADAAAQFRAAAEKAGQAGTGQFQAQPQAGGGGAGGGGARGGGPGAGGAWGTPMEHYEATMGQVRAQAGGEIQAAQARVSGATTRQEYQAAVTNLGEVQARANAKVEETRVAAEQKYTEENRQRTKENQEKQEELRKQQKIESDQAMADMNARMEAKRQYEASPAGKAAAAGQVKAAAEVQRVQGALEQIGALPGGAAADQALPGGAAVQPKGPGAPAGAGTQQQQGESVGPKIDTSNQHLAAIKDAIQKALTASGAT